MTLWVQRHPRDSEHNNQKEVDRIANIHINLLQGLIRTKFWNDADAKCCELKKNWEAPQEEADTKANTVEEVKKMLQSG